MRSFVSLIVLALLAVVSLARAADAPPSCSAGAKWTQPAPPLRIYGDTWFVGTCGISSILVTSGDGHVLIDGGVEENAPLIEANIRALGFRVEDVRYILNSHEHFDHAGGIARLQRDSGAVVVARAPSAAAFARGRGDRTDPQFESEETFPPIASVRTVDDGGHVTLGPVDLTAHATPGHTPGSTTWTWNACESGRCRQIVYADSLTAISDEAFRFSDDGAHPGVLAAFRRSIATVDVLPCDILLTPHPDASELWNRLGPHAEAPLVDARACHRYAVTAGDNLDKRIATERRPATP